MNSAVRRLLFFFFSIAAFSACQDPTDIGLNLQKDEDLIGTTFIELPVNTGTVLLNDSILSYRQIPLIGQYTDPALGAVKSTAFTEFGIAGSDLTFGVNAQAVSMELTLDYSGVYGNAGSNNLTLSVHRLTEGFNDRTSYFTNSALPYESTPLGTATITPKMLKKANSSTDSTSAENKIKIALNLDFANSILAQRTFASQESFANFVRGLAIVPSNGTSSNLLFLNYAADTSKITLTYKLNGSEELLKYTFRFNYSDVRYFNRVVADRAGTAVETLQNKGDFVAASETGGESYIQANTALLTKVVIPELARLKEQIGNVIINRAELVLPIKDASRTGYLTAPPQLVLYRTNNNNRIARNTNGEQLTVQGDRYSLQTSTNYPAVLSIPAKKELYTVNITSYVQALMLGDVPNNELLVGAASVTSSSTTQGALTVSLQPLPYRTIITNTPTQPAKLLIYYSKLN
ncbi:DUF4270 family protein [Pontibacter sp. SGAir0037]|uniref:DUF4270 family protein n=1 Tax=Pontibacter sp. SGAir0037 TaxID=2571030 RepID=UPI0010CD432E|nr:DUF4270 family protein [Pontibacter sp. SGAir0037]QCR24052.1 hypothetical protein C1N53_17950 [Pontibacter sp. SGAir0037]